MKGFLSILVAIVSTLSHINAGIAPWSPYVGPYDVPYPLGNPPLVESEDPSSKEVGTTEVNGQTTNLELVPSVASENDIKNFKIDKNSIVLVFSGTSPLQYLSLSGSPVSYGIPTPLSWPITSQIYGHDALGQYQYDSVNADSPKYGAIYSPYYYIDKFGELKRDTYISDKDVSLMSTTSSPKTPEAVENLNNDQDEATINNDSIVVAENDGINVESDVSYNNNDAIADDDGSDGDDGGDGNSNSGSDSNDLIPDDGSESNTESYNNASINTESIEGSDSLSS